MEQSDKRLLHKAFILTIVVKGIDALLEVIGGLFLLLISPVRLGDWIVALTQHELSVDPNDFIFSRLADLGQHLTAGSQHFGAFYLLSHGLVRLLVVIYLLRGSPRAYPVMIILLISFIIYQLYRYSYSHAVWLLLLTLFDVLVIFLTWSEYQWVKRGKVLRNGH